MDSALVVKELDVHACTTAGVGKTIYRQNGAKTSHSRQRSKSVRLPTDWRSKSACLGLQG